MLFADTILYFQVAVYVREMPPYELLLETLNSIGFAIQL